MGENVYGLVNWSGGLVFHEVQADLEAQGYEVQPYLLPAVSVNAPHRRDRIWFVAHANNSRTDIGMPSERERQESNGIWGLTQPELGQTGRDGDAADTEYKGLEGQHRKRNRCTKYRCDKGLFIRSENQFNAADTNGIGLRRQGDWIGESGFIGKNSKRSDWNNFPTVSPVRYGNDGISDRLDGITFPKWRNESIKAGGNAVVPQLVFQIFKTIEAYEKMGI